MTAEQTAIRFAELMGTRKHNASRTPRTCLRCAKVFKHTHYRTCDKCRRENAETSVRAQKQLEYC